MQGPGAVGLRVSAFSDLQVKELGAPARCPQEEGTGKLWGMQIPVGVYTESLDFSGS